MHGELNEQVGLLNVSPKSRENQRKETDRARKTMTAAEQKFREKRFLCARSIIPTDAPARPGKAVLVVSPARRDFNVARAANARARTGLACSRPRNNSRRCRAQPRMYARPLKIRRKGKKRTRFIFGIFEGRTAGKMLSRTRIRVRNRHPSRARILRALEMSYRAKKSCPRSHSTRRIPISGQGGKKTKRENISSRSVFPLPSVFPRSSLFWNKYVVRWPTDAPRNGLRDLARSRENWKHPSNEAPSYPLPESRVPASCLVASSPQKSPSVDSDRSQVGSSLLFFFLFLLKIENRDRAYLLPPARL